MKEYDLRVFHLERTTDVTGVSGTGKVASGVEFDDGTCVLRWETHTNSTVFYQSIEDLEKIHGHDGATLVVFDWERPYAQPIQKRNDKISKFSDIY